MNAVGATLGASVVLWGAFLASPYVAILRTADAVSARDLPAIAERVNVYAVRASLARQLVASGLSGTDLERLQGSGVGIGSGTIATTLGPLLAEIVTPVRTAGLIADADNRDNGRPGRLGRAASLVAGSRWRGFRNVSVVFPPGTRTDRQVRVQFRLSRFSWRIVSVDLPAPARAELVRSLAELRDRP